MPSLDLTEPFDVHEHRAEFKLLKQDATSYRLANRADYECPACGRVFERLLVTEDRTVAFNSPPPGPICLGRTPTQTLVFTHS